MFVLISMLILGLSKWSFQWITNFVNYIINIQSYQNRNKIIFHSNSFFFACFSIALQCCKYARMIFHCATVLVVLSICALRENIADDAMQMDIHKTLYPCYTTRKMPHVTVTTTKNALLAAVVRYNSITTIYTVGYLQIFNTGYFFSSKHWHIAMIYKEGSIGFPWFSTKTQIMTSFYLASRAAHSWIFNWTNNWTCFWKFRADCRLPP